MGCLLTAVSSAGDPAADGEGTSRSERWKAGPLALRRRNYLRRVSTLVSCGHGDQGGSALEAGVMFFCCCKLHTFLSVVAPIGDIKCS